MNSWNEPHALDVVVTALNFWLYPGTLAARSTFCATSSIHIYIAVQDTGIYNTQGKKCDKILKVTAEKDKIYNFNIILPAQSSVPQIFPLVSI